MSYLVSGAKEALKHPAALLADKRRRVRIDPAVRWAGGAYLAALVLYMVWANIVAIVFPRVARNLELFGAPVIAVLDAQTGQRYVFSRVVGGRTLTFRLGEAGTIVDAETGSVWQIEEERAVSGALVGAKMGRAAYGVEDVFPYRGVAPAQGPLGVWQRFDALWYQAIAERGYGTIPGDAHFPPLFPTAMRIAGLLMGKQTFLAGWLISQAALFSSLVLLYQTAGRWAGDRVARRAVVIQLMLPTAFFFYSAYSESLYLLFVLLCFSALKRGSYVRTGVWAAAAILTRLQGVALILPLACFALTQRGFGGETCAGATNSTGQNGHDGTRIESHETRLGLLNRVLVLGLPLAALGGYLVLRAAVGEVAVLPVTEPQLAARLVPPWENIWYAVQTLTSGRFIFPDLLNFLAFALAAAFLALGWRRLPLSFALFAAGTLVVASIRFVDTQPLNSMTRYLLTCFPLVLLLADWSRNRWVERALVYVSIPLALYLSAQFVLWGWVA